jgi:cell division protein FtsB
VFDTGVERSGVPGKKQKRRSRAVLLRRWFAVGALVLIGLLYYRPLKAYVDAHAQLAQREQAVLKLKEQRARLKQQLGASTSVATLAREARARLGYVRPGEHLFIVKGINEWRKLQREELRGGKAGKSR